MRRWNRENKEKSRVWRWKRREQNREKLNACARKSYQTRKASGRLNKQDVPKEQAAGRLAVFRAIKTGRLKRLPCEVCGYSPADAHHEDYSLPLDVVWLCRYHHRILHNGRKVESP